MTVLFGAGSEALPEDGDRSFKFRRILVLLLCILLFLSLVKYSPEDLDYLAGGLSGVAFPRNLLGVVGARVGWFMMVTFGLGSYFLTGLLLLCSMRRLFWRRGLKKSGFEYPVCILLAGIAFLFLDFPRFFFPLSRCIEYPSFPGRVIGHFFCAAYWLALFVVMVRLPDHRADNAAVPWNYLVL